ncbi:DsbA family protein [Mesobacterium pallidum]|uniref:DsbA family protein n=1 Tax=Mesobacterium pallidum TaxID=2872037 RepID=UPI001EE2FF83|nr:DsbA family protein [Mesobacterium pallidum]
MIRLTSLAAAAVALTLGGAWYMTQGSGNLPVSPMAANAQEAGEIDTSTITEMFQGNPDATVEVIEYASYTCPHCANFHQNVYPQLKADYIDSGKIKFVFREVYFDKYGMWASMIARCGGPEKFFGITDLMYKGQSDWARESSELGIANALRKIGLLAGIENEELEACLQDQDQLRTLVAWYQENATRDGINSTPSFVINGTKYSNMNYADFSELLDEKLGE